MRKAPYQMIGGEAGVEQLVKLFYDIVEKDPAGASLLAMHNHGHGLAHAREAQFEFLSGFFWWPKTLSGTSPPFKCPANARPSFDWKGRT